MADYGTEQNLRLAQQMLEQQGEINALTKERDALKAAIADVRRLCDMTIATSCRGQATDTLAVLDRALVVPESTQADSTDRQTTQHTDRHGRTWDAHPFVQSRAVDNVGVCICGQSPGHRIHAPETTPDAPAGGEDSG